MIARVMEGFVLSFVCFCVVGSLTVSTIQVEEDYDVQLVNTDAPKPELENEINASYGDASLDNFGVEARLKRVAVPEQDTLVRTSDSRFKHAEVYGKSPGDGIYWKDNLETRRLGHGEATVTRVIHHGIYPSLNVTEPVGQTNWTSRFTKSRTKRDWFGSKGGSSVTKVDHRYESTGSSNGTYHRETSFQVKDGPRTVYDARNSQNDTSYTRYEAHYPPNNANRQPYDAANQNPAPRKTKPQTKRDWLGGNARSSSTKVDYRFDSTSSSNGTYHRETSFQVKDGSRTVHDTRNSQDGVAYTRYEAHSPPNNNNRRYDATNVQNTTPRMTNYKYDSTGSSSGTYHRETSFQVKDGPRTVHDARNSQDGATYTRYESHYPPNNDNRNYDATYVQNTTPRVTNFVRARRNSGFGASRRDDYRNDSAGRWNGTFHRQTSLLVSQNSQNGTIKTTYQAHYPPHNSSTIFQNPNYDSKRNFSYARAIHPVNGSRDYSFYTHQFQQPVTNRTNSTTKYRTLYFPASNSVNTFNDNRKDANNKGNVRLISVGYYSVNESRDGVRSYYNPSVRRKTDYRESPTTNGFEQSRYRRDTSKGLGWLDRLFVSIGLAKLKSEQEEIPTGSETVKLEVSDGGNEVLQNHYGYSSNGHHHVEPTQIDRIYLVGGASATSTVTTPVAAAVETTMEQATSDGSSYEDISSSSEELQILLPDESLQDRQPETAILSFSEGPRTKEVLIQAPPRVINCRPPKRLARGRCRTVW